MNKTLYSTREETTFAHLCVLPHSAAPRVSIWRTRERNEYFLHLYCNLTVIYYFIFCHHYYICIRCGCLYLNTLALKMGWQMTTVWQQNNRSKQPNVLCQRLRNVGSTLTSFERSQYQDYVTNRKFSLIYEYLEIDEHIVFITVAGPCTSAE